MTTAAQATDGDPCDAHIRELTLLLEDAAQDSGHLRTVLGHAAEANDERPCACRRLPLMLAVATEVLRPGDGSAEEVRRYRSQSGDCDPEVRLAFARLRFTALDGRAKRHLRGVPLTERILGKRYRVAAWWAGMHLELEEASARRPDTEPQRV
ncbi:MAG TPA: hypothetical protein VFZ62_03310 [Candidatus Saccharimonadales bacterium]